eukprot:SAG11_NODE_26382_length_346_cov_0.558704_1_plen_61_part_10
MAVQFLQLFSAMLISAVLLLSSISPPICRRRRSAAARLCGRDQARHDVPRGRGRRRLGRQR